MLLSGRDVVGQSQTGSGKTAAFALPAIERVDVTLRAPQVLVLCPTRELAMQVAEAVHKYGRELGIAVLPIFGGSSYGQQLRALTRGVDVVVATPGRARDHINRQTLDLSAVGQLLIGSILPTPTVGYAESLLCLLGAGTSGFTPVSRPTTRPWG